MSSQTESRHNRDAATSEEVTPSDLTASNEKAILKHNSIQDGGSGMVIALLIFAFIATAVMGFRQIAQEAKSITQQADLPIYGEIPDFSLQRESGAPFTRFDIRDKIWVADFIFTRCAGPCPIMTQKMSELHSVLGGIDDLRFVTFTVDPEYDTADVLAKYAASYGANTNSWIFLTGNRTRIYDLCIKNFMLGLEDQSKEDYEHMIIHSTKFVLVDRKGRIRGYYDGREPAEITKLVSDIQKLVKQGAN